MAETWLSREFPDEFLDIKDFVIFRKDRDNGNHAHGCVLIAVISSLNPNVISIDTDLEVCYINTNFSGRTFKLSVVYRPKTSNPNNNQHLYNIMSNQIWNADRLCVLGNLNFPNIDWNTISLGISEK